MFESQPRTVLLTLAALALLAAPSLLLAQNGTIGIYADPEGTSTRIIVEPGVPTTIYVLAHLEGETASGIDQAEFRIAGLPASYFVLPLTYPPNSIELGFNCGQGSVFCDGTILGLGWCLTPTDGVVQIFAIQILTSVLHETTTLSVEVSNVPSGNPCPMLSPCDSYELVCMAGGQATLSVIGGDEFDAELSGPRVEGGATSAAAWGDYDATATRTSTSSTTPARPTSSSKTTRGASAK